jgi:cholinesterase
MHPRKAAQLLALLVVALVSLASPASATPFSSIFVYGDSLSDLGNIYAASIAAGLPPTPPSPPYYMGRFSNGPLAVEYLATSLHVPLTSFAWGGATTGVGNSGDMGTQTSVGHLGLPGMETQVLKTFGSIPPALIPSSLFVVWGGPDDYISGGTVQQGVTDVLTIVGALQLAGAQHILVPGMADLGLTPAYLGNTSATAFSFAFDQTLHANLPKGVTYFDTFGFMQLVVSNPGKFGFMNVTQPCLVGMTLCSTQIQVQNQYLFWDDLHPTTAADQILAAQFEKAVTPEPSAFLLLGTGIAGLAGILRRKLSA